MISFFGILFCSLFIGIVCCVIFGSFDAFCTGMCVSMILLAVLGIGRDILSMVVRRMQEDELNRRGLKTMPFRNEIRHRYDDLFGAYYVDETKTEDIIVPMTEEEIQEDARRRREAQIRQVEKEQKRLIRKKRQ